MWSYNAETGEVELASVARVFVREGIVIVEVGVGGQTIETTAEHPFWVEGEGWVDAEALSVGATLRRLDGTFLTVESVEPTPRTATVYNFEVRGNHNYFVRADMVLVHNNKKCLGVCTRECHLFHPEGRTFHVSASLPEA